MGDRVQVGTLIYTVLETEWLDQLGEDPNSRMPRNRFLTVRLSVTNSGSAPSGVPLMSVADASGHSFAEMNDTPAPPEWLGYIRTVNPADTLHGRVVFDVPAGAYRLMVSDDAEPENVKSAAIELPLQLDRVRVQTSPAGGQ
jgi:hypothetical protein